MKISAVSPAINYAHFNASRKNKASNQQFQTYDFIDSKKLALVSGTLALATITATGLHILKKNNTTISKELVKVADKVKQSIKDFNDPPIEKILKGKRDAEAVTKYQQYRAQKKLDSLNRRLLNGEFSNKPQRVFNALKQNEIKLANRTGNASNFIH